METKHTPKPWIVVDVRDAKNNPCGYSVWHGKEQKYIDDPAGKKICQTPDGTTKENLANARLIAAAPELLEALKKLLIEWEFCIDHDRDHMPIADFARKAIRKATGE